MVEVATDVRHQQQGLVQHLEMQDTPFREKDREVSNRNTLTKINEVNTKDKLNRY